jgi:hypothetical protein
MAADSSKHLDQPAGASLTSGCVNTRTRGLSVVGVAFALAVSVLPACGDLGALRFTGDFETGDTSQWDEEHQGADSDDDVYAQSEVKFEGAYAGRFIVEPGDKFGTTSGERAEVSKGRAGSGRFGEGEDRWFGWSVFFPEDFPLEPQSDRAKATWNVFTSWHHTGPTCSVPLDVAVNSGARPPTIILTQRTGTLEDCALSGREFVLGEFSTGDWLTFEVHVRFSSNPVEGFVEAYLNGRLALRKTQMATLYPGYASYLNQGFYRDDWPASEGGKTASLYMDGTKIGTSRAEVAQ